MLRRSAWGVLPVYALVFVAGMVQSALAPLGPIYAADLHLSRVQIGALFAATGVAMLVVALPIGVVTDRLGARRLIVGAAGLVGLSALGQGLAHEFWLLLASRAAFGVAYGAVWTAGLAFLVEGGPVEQRSARLGVAIPFSGAASAIGPAFAGVVAAQFGVGMPFVVIAAASAAVAVALAVAPAELPMAEAQRPAPARVLRGGVNRLVLGAVAIMVVSGFSSSLSYVLVPLRLRANGVPVAAIGTILAGAAALYIAAGVATARRLGAASARPAAGAAAVGALALVLALPALSTATAALVVVLLVRAACNAVTSTIAYPLASAGAAEAGGGAGAAIGLVNAAWAASTVVAPLVGGAVAQAASDRLAFGLLVPVTLATAVWLLGGRRRGR